MKQIVERHIPPGELQSVGFEGPDTPETQRLVGRVSDEVSPSPGKEERMAIFAPQVEVLRGWDPRKSRWKLRREAARAILDMVLDWTRAKASVREE